MRAAVFSDVEGTLIDGSLPRIFLELGEQMGIFSPWQRARIRALRRAARPWGAGMERNALIVCMVIATSGQTPEAVRQLVERSKPVLVRRLKPGSHSRIRAHQRAGLPLILLSAGMHEAITGLAEELDGRGEGTRIQLRNGRFRARFDGPLLQGEAKAARAVEVAAELGIDMRQSYAYGDTAGDIPFLSLFGHPHAVDPDRRLAAHAQQHGWAVVDGKPNPPQDAPGTSEHAS